MTTREFIEMLQEADPSGDSHIRMEGGIPWFAESKPGYWDGPYEYIDSDGNWVLSTRGSKVDIRCMDMDSFIEGLLDPYAQDNWKRIESKLIADTTYSIPEHREERKAGLVKRARESFEMWKDIRQQLQAEGKIRAMENSSKGWRFFQNRAVEDITLNPNLHHYYTWIVLDENGKEKSSNPLNVEFVYKSGFFERIEPRPVKKSLLLGIIKKSIDMSNYFEWVLKDPSTFPNDNEIS